MNNKSYASIGIAFALLILAACGGKTNGTDGNETAKNALEKKREPVELIFYHTGGDWNQEGYFMKEYGDAIQKKFPHVTAKFLPTSSGTLDKLVAANQQLDLIVSSVGSSFNSVFAAGLQSDLAPLVSKYKFDVNRFEPGSIEMAKQMGNGVLYGLPLYTAPAPIYYNKDIFNKFGVSYPKDGTTWDELYDIAKKLTRKDGNVQYYGLAISPNHYMLRNQLSIKVVDPKSFDVTVNTDQAKALVENIVRFYQLPDYAPTKSKISVSGQRSLFTKDKTAAMWLPVSTMHTEQELQGINWDLAMYPVWKGLPDTGPQAYPYYMYISQTSKSKDAAFEVMDYLLSDEFQMDKSKQALFVSMLKSDDIRQSFGKDAPMYNGKHIKALLPAKLAAPSLQSKYFSIAISSLGVSMMESILLNGKDINTALREAQESVVKQIKEDQAK